mmetsp:Transcript_19580/g.38920  ORF Transcript_19580/g.38920 Transcript_19580/m.38920 type:complete len:122 (+) Transcript_19580:265-630(+)
MGQAYASTASGLGDSGGGREARVERESEREETVDISAPETSEDVTEGRMSIPADELCEIDEMAAAAAAWGEVREERTVMSSTEQEPSMEGLSESRERPSGCGCGGGSCSGWLHRIQSGRRR